VCLNSFYASSDAGLDSPGVRMRFLRRRGFVAATAGAVALATVLVGCSPQQTVELDLPAQVDAALPDATIEQLQGAMSSAMTATGSSGAIVGVWAPWSGTWVTGLGTQNIGGGDAVSADMVFRAADVTRAMTCDVLFQVADEGTVALDDPVTDYVAGFPDLTDVTLRHLCDSTSGVGSYAPHLQSQWFGNPDRRWNPSELVSYGLGEGRDMTPGSAYRDSDAGYLLLGLALQRATQRDLSDLIADRVAEPLELDRTSLPPATAQPPSTTAPVLDGHWSVADGAGVWNCTEPADMTTLSASVGWADSGAVTDIDDLGRYAQALATQALVPDGSARFDAPLAVAGDQPTWFTTRGGAYQAGSLVGQYGAVPGYMTAAFADPVTGLTVAVVLNNSGANPAISAWLAWELAAIASRAPAAAGQTAPEAGPPWTAEQFRDQIAANAICAPPAQ
jgi:D-alanyl-D-alanine carboxypeptidase